MPKAKRIFLIADFKDESAQSIRIERRHWAKGFIRLGHDVQRFSYRNMMMQLSPVRTKTAARWFAKKRADKALLDQVKHYHPDIILMLAMKFFDAKTVAAMREAAPDAIFVGRDTSWFPGRNKARLAIAREADWVIATNAGRFLKAYKEAGVPRCAFIPCPCDPDIQRPYEVPDRFKSDIVFTGKVDHGRHESDQDRERLDLLGRLSKWPDVRLYGAFGFPRVEGIDCFYALSGAKIALSINAVNDVRMYHSDRLINSLSCGTFVLAKRVPDTELLFQDKVHLKYFDSAEEFFDQAEYYLRNDREREKIARAGMERAHAEFNCTKMAQRVLDLVQKGSYDAPWAVIL